MKESYTATKFNLLLKLTRISMSSAIAFSALAGYIVCKHSLDGKALSVFLGVLLLAGAASALNQYQERDLDLLMKRTKNRPLPLKLISPERVVMIGILLGFTGSLILYFFTTPATALLGLFNICWYNGVYTPLKRKTSYVVIIGAVTGAIPPMMGWAAAGGNLLSSEILFIAAFMFLWQIPHFCLLLIKYKEDYKAAGFPSLTSLVSDKHVKIIVFTWILGTSVCTMFFPMLHVIADTFLISCLMLLNIILILLFYRNTFGKNIVFSLRSAFGSLYLYQIIILIMLIIQALI